MAWLARDKDNDLYVYINKPKRDEMRSLWRSDNTNFVRLSSNADRKIIYKTITWEDEPVEI